MAKEYQRTSGGTLQWRDTGAGVQGWNNIERDEEPASQRLAATPAPPPASPPPTPPPMAPPPPAGGPATAGPASAAVAGLAGAAPAMPEFSPIMAPAAPAGNGGMGGSTVIQGQMDPGPGFVESGAGAGALRGLGVRRPPEQSSALAGLGRAY